MKTQATALSRLPDLTELRRRHGFLVENLGAGNGLRIAVKSGCQIKEAANAMAQRAVGESMPMADRESLAETAIKLDPTLVE